MPAFHVGQRLSLRGERLTVRYVGPVQGKSGVWLGVEWDNYARGKHDGTLSGTKYFTCKSRQKNSASFLGQNVLFDNTQSLTEAIRARYASSQGFEVDTVQISGKVIEEKGYDKITLRQRRLEELKVAVIDGQQVVVGNADGTSRLETVSPAATELNLGRNLLESMSDVVEVIVGHQALRTLSLEGNRLHDVFCKYQFHLISDLNLDMMLLSATELATIIDAFPLLMELSAASNNLLESRTVLRSGLKVLKLNSNDFTSLQQVRYLVSGCSNLEKLVLKDNQISATLSDPSERLTPFGSSLSDVDLTLNTIAGWDFVNDLAQVCPGLQHLRISQNPIYNLSRRLNGRSLSYAEVSMIISARLSSLVSLNISPITTKDRFNSEVFYLSTIAEELSLSPEQREAHQGTRHPRYEELCKMYGEPVVANMKATEIDPKSIEARLITLHVSAGEVTSNSIDSVQAAFTTEVPTSFSVYNLYSHISRQNGRSPDQFRLIWQTGEKDLRSQGIDVQQTIEEWDSEEDLEQEDWVQREEPLVPGTRPLGSIVQGKRVRLHLEVLA